MPFTDPKEDIDVSRSMNSHMRAVEPLYNLYWHRLCEKCCAKNEARIGDLQCIHRVRDSSNLPEEMAQRSTSNISGPALRRSAYSRKFGMYLCVRSLGYL